MRIRTRGVVQSSPGATPAAPSTDLTRRRFLLSLSAGGAGAAAVAVAASPAAAAAIAEDRTESTDDAAYRETAHVRDYYRTTRL
jgi:hypothetical protein